MTLLWHGDDPVGICVFSSSPQSLSQRNRFFGLGGQSTRLKTKALDRQLLILSRVVLHPAYRGAGIAVQFVRRSCQLAPRPWIEAQTQMGWVNPFFEKAGFIRVGHAPLKERSRSSRLRVYGKGRHKHDQQTFVSKQADEKNRFAQPVYYIFDNREAYRKTR